jgi:hypothetical protein
MDRAERLADHDAVTDGTPSDPEQPQYWWLRLILETLAVATLVVVGHLVGGLPGAALRSLPYVFGATVVFVVAQRRMRGARKHPTLTNLALAALMAYAWPITTVIWLLAMHHSGSPTS